MYVNTRVELAQRRVMGVGVERGVMVGEGEEGGSEMTRRGKVEEENKENSD